MTREAKKDGSGVWTFQYRKRYEVTCDLRDGELPVRSIRSFNTASGMRSHVTRKLVQSKRMQKLVSIPQAV